MEKAKLLNIIEKFTQNFPYRHLFYISYNDLDNSILLTVLDREHKLYDYKIISEKRRLNALMLKVGNIALICNELGKIILVLDKDTRLFVETLVPLFKFCGFKKDALMFYGVSDNREVLSYIMDVENLYQIDLAEVVPEEITLGESGSGALSFEIFNELIKPGNENYLKSIVLPFIARVIINKVFGAEVTEITNIKDRSTTITPYLINLGGEEYIVYYALSPTPIREYIVATAFNSFRKALARSKVKRGIMLLIYVERLTIDNLRVFTPRFFWYMLTYDIENGHMGAPSSYLP